MDKRALLKKESSLPSLEPLAAIPMEDILLESQPSKHRKRAYKSGVLHFMKILGIKSREEFRRVDRMTITA